MMDPQLSHVTLDSGACLGDCGTNNGIETKMRECDIYSEITLKKVLRQSPILSTISVIFLTFSGGHE